jgi:hypothetical protein
MKVKSSSRPSEIEITPEMIEAGALALACHEPMFNTLEEGADAIFRAMLGASKNIKILGGKILIQASC